MDEEKARPEEQRRIWRSCCVDLDADMVQFATQTVIALFVLCFAATQLYRLEDCNDVQPYFGMITFILGVYCKNPMRK